MNRAREGYLTEDRWKGVVPEPDADADELWERRGREVAIRLRRARKLAADYDDVEFADVYRAIYGLEQEGHALRGRQVIERARRLAKLRTERSVEAFGKTMERLAEWVPPTTMRMWVEPCQLVGEWHGRLLLAAPPAIQRWTARRYEHLISDAVKEVSDLKGAVVAPTTGPLPPT